MRPVSSAAGPSSSSSPSRRRLPSAIVLSSLLFLLCAPCPIAASPPATPATFASSTLMALHIALGPDASAGVTTHAARTGSLLELAPPVCRPACTAWTGIETTCVRLKIVQNCNEPFCTTEMMDSFLGCINCLLLNGGENSIPETRFAHLSSQITTLQNACTQYAGLVSPTVRLANYEHVGANSTGSLDEEAGFELASVRSYTASTRARAAAFQASAGSSTSAGSPSRRASSSALTTLAGSTALGLTLASLLLT